MKPKSALLLGSYGQSNLGDDLLMWNFLELLKERGFNKIYVNANTTELIPEPIKKAYPDLHIINTYETSIFQYFKLIRNVGCIAYGGGTLYKELYSSTGRSKYSVIVRMMGVNLLAKWSGTKLYHLNIGIGSLKTAIGRFISKTAISASTHTVFRDKKSYEIARTTLGIAPSKISKATDGLFINHVWENVWNTSSLHKKTDTPTIGINVLSDIPDWVDREKYIDSMRRFVAQLCRNGANVVFVPFQHTFNPRNDLAFTRENFGDLIERHANCTVLEGIPIDEISDCLRKCDVFVGMRFHSLLLSAANRVPFVAVAYDTKCWRFIEENDYPHAIELEKLETEALLDLYENALHSKKQTAALLDTVTKRTYKEAEEALRTLSL